MPSKATTTFALNFLTNQSFHEPVNMLIQHQNHSKHSDLHRPDQTNTTIKPRHNAQHNDTRVNKSFNSKRSWNTNWTWLCRNSNSPRQCKTKYHKRRINYYMNCIDLNSAFKSIKSRHGFFKIHWKTMESPSEPSLPGKMPVSDESNSQFTSGCDRRTPSGVPGALLVGGPLWVRRIGFGDVVCAWTTCSSFHVNSSLFIDRRLLTFDSLLYLLNSVVCFSDNSLQPHAPHTGHLIYLLAVTMTLE